MKKLILLTIFVTLQACGGSTETPFNQDDAVDQWKESVDVTATFTGEIQHEDEAQVLVNAGWFDASKCMGIGASAYDTLQAMRNDMDVVITSSGTCDPQDAGLIQVNVNCDEANVARQILRYAGALNGCNY